LTLLKLCNEVRNEISKRRFKKRMEKLNISYNDFKKFLAVLEDLFLIETILKYCSHPFIMKQTAKSLASLKCNEL